MGFLHNGTKEGLWDLRKWFIYVCTPSSAGRVGRERGPLFGNTVFVEAVRLGPSEIGQETFTGMPKSTSVDGALTYECNEKALLSSQKIMVDVEETGFCVCRKF